MSIRWWGIACTLPRVGLAVPISIPRYTAMESSEMISASSKRAISIPTLVFPAAVGPVKYQQSKAGGMGEGNSRGNRLGPMRRFRLFGPA